MAGAQPGAVVPVEVFVEQDMVAPVGIALEFLSTAIDWSSAITRVSRVEAGVSADYDRGGLPGRVGI